MIATDEKAALEQAHQLRVAAARVDFPTFGELVLRDENTGAPIELAPLHEDISELLDSESRLVLHSHVESGKSALVGVGRLLYELGRNPNLRCAYISATHGQAVKVARAISSYIHRSPELRAVFPALRPASPWAPDKGSITVERSFVSRDPSLQALGVGGELLGARLDLVILDDALSYESTRTAEQRQRVIEWFRAVLLGRLVEGGRCWILGTAWHRHDLLHVMAREGWTHRRFGVEDENGNPRWPARWPAKRIAAKRVELGTFESARQLDCLAVSDEEARFKAEWIESALVAGKGVGLPNGITAKPADWRVITAVDFAAGQTKQHDESAVVSIAVAPNRKRQLLAVEHGRWPGPETLRRVGSAARRYCADRVVAESNGIQLLVADVLSEKLPCPVDKFSTGSSKHNLRLEVERFAAELERGQWIFPCDDPANPPPQVRRLINAMVGYDPRSHVDDVLVALALARWGAHRGEYRVEYLNLGLLNR